ncbi:hypothetical protein L218DRAFT_952426 [Marasmius fiardii PR-910]|nr:hypothetical protein L218DRAFT_952426 [Marasmius fiardii PR-910]
MHRSVILSFLLFSFLTLFVQAQQSSTNSSSNSQSNGGSQSQTSAGNQTSPTVVVITSTGSDSRVQTITSTLGGSSGNSNGNSSQTTSKPLPTAATDALDGARGGGATGAPSPGGDHGAYGPDDNYIAAAQSIPRNIMLVTFAGVMVGAIVTLL